jgi:hypothetical protein
VVDVEADDDVVDLNNMLRIEFLSVVSNKRDNYDAKQDQQTTITSAPNLPHSIYKPMNFIYATQLELHLFCTFYVNVDYCQFFSNFNFKQH